MGYIISKSVFLKSVHSPSSTGPNTQIFVLFVSYLQEETQPRFRSHGISLIIQPTHEVEDSNFTAIICLNRINRLNFAMETRCVLSEVANGFLMDRVIFTQMRVGFKGLLHSSHNSLDSRPHTALSTAISHARNTCDGEALHLPLLCSPGPNAEKHSRGYAFTNVKTI